MYGLDYLDWVTLCGNTSLTRYLVVGVPKQPNAVFIKLGSNSSYTVQVRLELEIFWKLTVQTQLTFELLWS